MSQTEPQDDRYNLARFSQAQERVYNGALAELRAGRKRSHWMWFIFPQIAGLGRSEMSQRYAITGLDEARAYLSHPVLGPHLRECAQAVLDVEGRTASEIFGDPDDMKLRSSMTLFAYADSGDSVFVRVLQKYFGGKEDGATLRRLGHR
jgi:uncharacterized protein (DUF1810 family)